MPLCVGQLLDLMYKYECDPHNTAGVSEILSSEEPASAVPAGSSVGKVGIFVPAGHDEAWALYSGGPWRLRPFFRQEGVKELCEEMHRSETRRWTFASKSKRLLHVYVARARNSRRSRRVGVSVI